MYTTSDAYKENQNAVYREVFYEIEYGQIDPDARDTAVIEYISPVTIFSKPDEILNDRVISSNVIIGTLEEDQFLLDGSRVLTPEAPPDYEVGAWGNVLSGESGTCEFYCQIQTTGLINAPGLTITFYQALKQYAVDFDIVLLDGTTEVKRIEITENQDVVFETEEEITDCNRVRIEINKWSLPNYYPKITQLDFGLYTLFNPDNLTSMFIQNKASAISESLPLSTLVFKFVNDGKYDPIFETGRNKFVQDRQPVRSKIGSNNEQIENMYYELSGRPNVTLGEVEVKASGLMIKFEKEQPIKWKSNVSLYSIAEEIMQECGVAKFEIDTSLNSMMVTCLITENYRDTLTDLLIASQCVFVQRKDTLCIETRNLVPVDYTITKENSKFPEISIQDDVKKIIVYKNTYSLGAVETLTTFTAPSTGEHILSVQNAMDISVSGGALTYAGINFVKVNATSGTTITVSGKPIKFVETKHEYGSGNIAKEIKGNPFIIDPQAVSTWILEYYLKRQDISVEWRQDNALELLDTITAESDYGDINVIIEEQSFEFDGGFKGTTKGRAV